MSDKRPRTKGKDKPANGTAEGTTKPPAFVSETTSGNVTATGAPASQIAATAAYDYFSAMATNSKDATLRLTVAGVVAFIIAAKANAKGARTFKTVAAELRRKCSERNVKTAMEYRIVQTAQQCTNWLDRRYHQGGLVHLVMTAATAEAACNSLLNSLKVDHGVTSFNTLRQVVTNRDNVPLEAKWDAAAIATQAALKAERGTDAYKRSIGIDKALATVDILASNSDMLPQVFIQAARKAERSIPQMVIPLAQGVVNPAECKEIIAAFSARWDTLKEAAKSAPPVAVSVEPQHATPAH